MAGAAEIRQDGDYAWSTGSSSRSTPPKPGSTGAAVTFVFSHQNNDDGDQKGESFSDCWMSETGLGNIKDHTPGWSIIRWGMLCFASPSSWLGFHKIFFQDFVLMLDWAD